MRRMGFGSQVAVTLGGQSVSDRVEVQLEVGWHNGERTGTGGALNQFDWYWLVG